MLDRTIPFYNTILRCDSYNTKEVVLPDGYSIVTYRAGAGYENDWARMECAIGDFDSEDEARDYFISTYVSSGRNCDIFFAVDNEGRAVGACMAWTDGRKGEDVNSLHWLVVDERAQRLGLGRALCVRVMNRFREKNGQPVYIHTQPWSRNAILLYVSEGFRLQKTDSFSHYVNQYDMAMGALAAVLDGDAMRILEEASDE